MKHIKPLSAEHPRLADDITTISSLINLLTAIVGLIGQVRAVFGLGTYLEKISAQ